MKNISPLFSLLRNKFFVSIVVFTVWVSFFDRNDLFTQYDRKNELKRLETSKSYYEGEIAGTKKELRDLTNNPDILEKFAREKFYLKRPDEDVFILVDSSLQKN